MCQLKHRLNVGIKNPLLRGYIVQYVDVKILPIIKKKKCFNYCASSRKSKLKPTAISNVAKEKEHEQEHEHLLSRSPWGY